MELLEDRLNPTGAVWEGYAQGPQHVALSAVASQPLNAIRWQTPVDLQPQYSGNDLLIHYGSPAITAADTVIVPVKTGASGGFEVNAFNGSTGAPIWSRTTAYRLPPSPGWTPSYGPVLTSAGKYYFPGPGGTLNVIDDPDGTGTVSGQVTFFGLNNYNTNPAAYNGTVFINTPLTADAAGNIYFGFLVTGSNPLNLKSGLARIAPDGTGTWVSAQTMFGDTISGDRVVYNCTPAVSNDGQTVYVAVNHGNSGDTGDLVALDSTSLAVQNRVALTDPSSGSPAFLSDSGTASPTVGPDGDVYFGVLENPFPHNHDRGWLLHFSGDLATAKTPGAFGWDDSASVVPASMVPSYHGTSTYLLMTKYNNYAGDGGDGVNRLAILDPNATQVDPITQTTVMREVLTVAGVTPDPEFTGTHPNAVREWCINTAVVDPATDSVLANSEDGRLYRWDLSTNTFTQSITLTPGIGEAYTPTLIGADGAVYAINNATLFAVGDFQVSTTALTASPNPSRTSDPVTFTATVTGPAWTATGTVTFLDGATVLGSAPLHASGVATITLDTLSSGTHHITAHYDGDEHFAPSTSPTLDVVHGPAVFRVNSLADLSLSPGVDTATGEIKGTHTVTLRSAVEAANATPGSNTILLTRPGTYRITIPPTAPDDTPVTENNLSGDFDILPNAASAAGSTLRIVNASGGAVAVSGNHLDRVFDINPDDLPPPAGFGVVLQGFTVTNGNASPGDGAAGSGGGIRDQGNVNLTLKNMVVTRNNATADGGGLVMFDALEGSWTLTVVNSTVSNNHAGDAGGGIDTDGTGTVVITGSRVIANTDFNQGAGIYIDVAAGSPDPAGADMTLTQSVVDNNSALATGITSSGGGISNAGTGAMTIRNCTVADNFSGANGGGFSDENNNGTLVVTGSLFVGNTAVGSGGGIQEGGPSTTISTTEFVSNSGGVSGGALFANGTTLTLSRSTFTDNTSAGNGGAIEVETTGTGGAGSTITDTTIADNQALDNGGANGGGIDAGTLGSLALQNDTINGNFATNGGGVFWDGSGTFSARNTIVAGNFMAAGGAGPDANNPAGAFTDGGGNLIGVSGAGGGNSGFTASATQTGTVASPLDPRLGPLQYNGGPIVGGPGERLRLQTEALLRGSPAIGKGVRTGAPATDERGFPSVVGGKINVGAVSQASG